MLLGMERATEIDVRSLTLQERLTLISRLWDSVEADALPLSPVQCDELDRRLAMLDADGGTGVGWEALKVEMESRCP